MTKAEQRKEAAANMLAEICQELSPAKDESGNIMEDEDAGRAVWLDHIKQTHNDPKAFFMGNGSGEMQYSEFLARRDADKERERLVRQREKKMRDALQERERKFR